MKLLSNIALTTVFCLIALTSNAADQTLSQQTYEALNDIQELISNDQKAEALAELKELEEDLNPGFALALTYQIRAQLALSNDDTKEALKYFNKALNLDALTPGQAVSLATNVAQLQLTSDPAESVKTLEPRISAAEAEKAGSVDALAYITMGSAYQIMQNYGKSAEWLSQGIERSKDPRENWLQMLMVAYYQEKQYPDAVRILSRLIAIDGKNETYWLQQASMYQLMNQPRNALITLEAAYLNQALEKESGLLLMVQLMITKGVPEKGARILSELLANQKLEINEKNWRLLAAAWIQSRERKKAIPVLEKAASLLSKDKDNKEKAGKLYYRAAGIAFDEGMYKEAADLFASARKTGLDKRKRADSLLMQGNAFFELKQYGNARRYFQQALNEPDTANNARSWLNYMQQMGVIN